MYSRRRLPDTAESVKHRSEPGLMHYPEPEGPFVSLS
jgi:hypothetical protein